MLMSEFTSDDREKYGAVKISEEVVKTIAGMAAIDISGVAGMSGGLYGGIAEMLGRKNISKGIKVAVGEKETAIDIYLIMEYGVRVPEVAANIQNKVKNAVESMTGLIVVEVNIHVEGVVFSNDGKDPERKVK
jgi:uncharacterized alkaline shock family protein YloU